MNQAKFKKKNKACFLDRDGVINKDIGYLYKKQDFQRNEGAIECISLLKKMKFKVIVITNQSGISRGFYGHEDVEKLHFWINKQLKKAVNTSIDQFYYSDEMPNTKVNSRRKPSPNMIFEAFQFFERRIMAFVITYLEAFPKIISTIFLVTCLFVLNHLYLSVHHYH